MNEYLFGHDICKIYSFFTMNCSSHLPCQPMQDTNIWHILIGKRKAFCSIPRELTLLYFVIQVYCEFSNNAGWTLVARFSNSDSKNWITSASLWYGKTTPYGNVEYPHHGGDMVSEGFWRVTGDEFKITRSDDTSDVALLQTTSNCLRGQTFRQKITSYGNFTGTAVWANSTQCQGSCSVRYGGQYNVTVGFHQHSCNSELQTANKIGFWCYWHGDGAVMMIGGGGSACARADHGIGTTEAELALFGATSSGYYDFSDSTGEGTSSSPNTAYSLNLWVR